MALSYDELSVLDKPARQAAARELIEGIRDGDYRANLAYIDLTQRIIRDENLDPAPFNRPELRHGEFAPLSSALLLVRYPERLRAFIQAIDRVPHIINAIGAGAGSAAPLEIAIATLHPESSVDAYEINGPAAKCAAAVVKLFGLEDRIRIHHADVLEASLPQVDFAVSETFSLGLREENGVAIMHALGRVAAEIMPAYAEMYASDMPVGEDRGWQKTGVIDLRADNTHVSGELIASEAGRRSVSVHVNFFDARQEPILIGPNAGDGLTGPSHLAGGVDVAQAGDTIGFRFPAGGSGAALVELWTAPAA